MKRVDYDRRATLSHMIVQQFVCSYGSQGKAINDGLVSNMYKR